MYTSVGYIPSNKIFIQFSFSNNSLFSWNCISIDINHLVVMGWSFFESTAISSNLLVIVSHTLVAPSDRNSGFYESDPDILDILAGILYRSEGKNKHYDLSARTIYVVESYWLSTKNNVGHCQSLPVFSWNPDGFCFRFQFPDFWERKRKTVGATKSHTIIFLLFIVWLLSNVFFH